MRVNDSGFGSKSLSYADSATGFDDACDMAAAADFVLDMMAVDVVLSKSAKSMVALVAGLNDGEALAGSEPPLGGFEEAAAAYEDMFSFMEDPLLSLVLVALTAPGPMMDGPGNQWSKGVFVVVS